MKNVFIALMSFALAATVSSCKKDKLPDIAGTYHHNDTVHYDMIVKKVDDNTVSVTVESLQNPDTVAITATMTTETTFTFTEVTNSSNGAGEGLFSGNNLTISFDNYPAEVWTGTK